MAKLSGPKLRIAAAREAARASTPKKKAGKKKARKKRGASKKGRKKRGGGGIDLGELDHAASVLDKARALIAKADGRKAKRR